MRNPTSAPPLEGGVLRQALRRDRGVVEIVRAYRRLTTPEVAARAGAGAPVLVALSGGADSSALLLALWSAKAPVVAGHVLHDLRTAAEARADRGACVALCARLGVPLLHARVKVKGRVGNAEGNARALRYAALARLARKAGVAWIATGHHGHDQLETVLLALLRGSGPRGLAGIAPSRGVGKGVRVIRPMLGVSPGDARRVCAEAGVRWCEDASNADVGLRRNRIRAGVLRELLAIKPDAAERAVQAGELLRDAERVVRRRAGVVSRRGAGAKWSRAGLARERPIVIGAVLGAAAKALSGRVVPQRVLMAASRVIRSDCTDPKRFSGGGCVIEVRSGTVGVVRG